MLIPTSIQSRPTLQPSSTLASGASVGATTVTLTSLPPGLQTGSVVLIDAYTTEAELRTVTNVSGNTLTVAATKYAHASGDTLLWIQDVVASRMYGVTDNSADNWGPIQRLVLETNSLGLSVRGTNGVALPPPSVAAPVCVPTGSRWFDFGFKTHASYTPVDTAGGLCMIAQRAWAFTATASDNTFTVAGGHGMGSYSATVHTKIVFNAPYGETLPGGITSGKVYYVDTVPTGTTFTVSATSGGSTLDVTSDGTGYGWESIDQLARVYWDNVRFDVGVADVSGVLLGNQQPGYVRNLRIEMSAAASSPGSAAGLKLSGQNSYCENLEINPWTNCNCMEVTGVGHVVRGFNSNGSAYIGILTSGEWHHFQDLWFEGALTGVSISPNGENARVLVFDGTIYANAATLFRCGNSQASFSVGPVYVVADGRDILNDSSRGITIKAWDGNTPPVGESYGYTFLGFDCWQGLAPELRARNAQQTSVSCTYNRQYRVMRVDTSGGNRTVTLPTAVGWAGWSGTIFNAVGANNVIVDPVGTETINGTSTYSVGPGLAIDFYSSGSVYELIG